MFNQLCQDGNKIAIQKKKTSFMKYLTLEETREIILKDIGDNDLLRIEEESIKDFQWGSLFKLEPAKEEATGNITGLPFLMVDKITGEIVPIDYQKNVDFQLEAYRKEKAYDHVIKFPAKGDLNKMSPIEKVFALCRTEELFQIEEAIKIIQSNNLFSVKGFAEVCQGKKTDKLAEAISRINGIKGDYYLYESDLKVIPDEIALFKNEITSLSIHLGEIEIISNEILKLENLESINIAFAPIKSMPFDLSNLKKLKTLSITKTNISTQGKANFIVPAHCEIIME